MMDSMFANKNETYFSKENTDLFIYFSLAN